MGVFAFEQGASVHIGGAEYRLLQQIDTYWQLKHAKTGRIREVEHDDLLRMYLNRSLTFSGENVETTRFPAKYDLSEEESELAKVRRAYVVEVLRLSSTSAVKEAIDRVWSRIKKPIRRPSFTTVWRWKSRYIRGDKDHRVLVDNNSAKGKRCSLYPRETLDACRQAIEAKFMTRERPTVRATYEDALVRFERERRLCATPQKMIPPTLRLISGMIQRIPAFDKCAARYGRDEARRRFRSVKGAVVTQKPLQRAEIDHTELDLIVVDDKNPQLKLGRPWVTACIDDYTRCPAFPVSDPDERL
jgi:putative transposase